MPKNGLGSVEIAQRRTAFFIQAEGISLRALWEQMEELIDLLEQVKKISATNAGLRFWHFDISQDLIHFE